MGGSGLAGDFPPLRQNGAECDLGGLTIEQLWPRVYDELRAVAHRQLAREGRAAALQTTMLVHEAWLRMRGRTGGDGVPDKPWVNRQHFFAAVARAMRRIRVDSARLRKAAKRGGGQAHVRLNGNGEGGAPGNGQDGWLAALAEQGPDPAELLAIDEALGRLEQIDPRKAEIISLRYFAGLTVEETATVLDISPRTVNSEWRCARAWLFRALSGDADGGPTAATHGA